MPRTDRDSAEALRAADAAQQASRRAVKFLLPGLLLAVIAFMMIEQPLRWLATSLTRSGFTKTEFQIDHLRDQPGKGGFAVDGLVVSSGERIHTTESLIVSVERLRELEAAGKIPGAREPVHYLRADAPWASLDPLVRFRVQSPETFEANAGGWVVFNVLFAAGAVWLIRRTVHVARRQHSTN